MDYFAQNALTNCELVNLEDMLQNGTVINGTMIDKPHRFITAATIATQIILSVTSSTYGGCTISLTHLAPFVRDSYNKYYKKYIERGLDEETSKKFAKEDTRKEVEDGVQTFNYQVNSMSNSNGQSPFLSVCMYLGETEEYKEELAMIIEEFFKQRILGMKNEKGAYVTPSFPKLLYILEEDNIHEDSKYWYLTELAAECTAKRMVPDYISEKIMKQYKIDKNGNGQCYPCMGCRSFLTPYINSEGKPQYYGRGNCGVVTINLPHVALSSGGDFDKFWELMEERLELCHRGLRSRYERISKITSDAAPILWQHGAFMRLPKHTPVKPYLHGGYFTISLGYAGLYECVKYMTGVSHTNEEKGLPFAIEVLQKLNDKCKEWKAAENLDYSVYGTPIESVTYKFAKSNRRDFGDDIEDITDKLYLTNSYHIPVTEEVDAFTKLDFEGKLQKLSPGGCISYVEIPSANRNVKVILQLIKFMYDHTMYAEINTKLDYCKKCGFDGEILLKGESGNHYFECPQCGNTDENEMNITRRVCGLT